MKKYRLLRLTEQGVGKGKCAGHSGQAFHTVLTEDEVQFVTVDESTQSFVWTWGSGVERDHGRVLAPPHVHGSYGTLTFYGEAGNEKDFAMSYSFHCAPEPVS